MAKKKRQTGKWSAYKGNNSAILRAPSSTQSLIPVFRVSENGDFELENITELHMFDRVYEFTDINYITKDYSEKEQILLAAFIIKMAVKGGTPDTCLLADGVYAYILKRLVCHQLDESIGKTKLQKFGLISFHNGTLLLICSA